MDLCDCKHFNEIEFKNLIVALDVLVIANLQFSFNRRSPLNCAQSIVATKVGDIFDHPIGYCTFKMVKFYLSSHSIKKMTKSGNTRNSILLTLLTIQFQTFPLPWRGLMFSNGHCPYKNQFLLF